MAIYITVCNRKINMVNCRQGKEMKDKEKTVQREIQNGITRAKDIQACKELLSLASDKHF